MKKLFMALLTLHFGGELLLAQITRCPQPVYVSLACDVGSCHQRVLVRECNGSPGISCCYADIGGFVYCCGQQIYQAGTSAGACPNTCQPPPRPVMIRSENFGAPSMIVESACQAISALKSGT